ncbi:MAG TPA: hypothetical protein VLE27_08815 [Thermoanaerobaculia bacterium]|nr:hypothetical protein [Thermoanaerobaculia bacterium]
MKRICFALLIASLTFACSANRPAATGGVEPGTGDIAFRLLWQGMSDLDLYVYDPAGNCVFFANPKSETGAILDIDCNGASDRVCESPIENVYWPASTAPAGTYTYWIQANSMVLTEGPVPFELQLLRGDRIVWSRKGSIQEQRGSVGPFAYAFAAGKSATPVEAAEQPACTVYRFLSEDEEEIRGAS